MIRIHSRVEKYIRGELLLFYFVFMKIREIRIGSHLRKSSIYTVKQLSNL